MTLVKWWGYTVIKINRVDDGVKVNKKQYISLTNSQILEVYFVIRLEYVF